MKDVYEIDLKNQLKSFRKGFELLGFSTSVILIVAVLIDNNLIEAFGIGLLFFIPFAVLFAFPIHLQYFEENRNMKLRVDKTLKEIEITKNEIVYKYNFEEIRTERYLYRKGYRPTPVDNYGYVKIIAPENKIFIITSLMADLHNFPLKINYTKRQSIFLEKEFTEAEIKQNKEDKINRYESSFDKLSDSQLTQKLQHREKYEKEAIEATERIITKRKNKTDAQES